MSMRHHILIPTDFSENAWSAALYALKLYAEKPCTFYFLHAWTFSSGSRTYVSPSYIDILQDKSKAHLAEVKELAISESTNSEHKFEILFRLDPLLDAIKNVIEEHHIDQIIMGTKGATGAKEFLLGSNTVSVIDKVRLCPLLLVPSNFAYVTPNQIGFPTDFNRGYGDELQPIKNLADIHNSRIKVLHINSKEHLTETQNANMDFLKTNLKDYQHSFNWVPDKGKKEHAIESFIEENNINILTMINYEHGIIEDFIKEPVIKRLGYHSDIPFFVVPHTN
ncbi:universal stress protein UspA [Arenibacter certesii]|uniref:Universal stress protein UspA n=2 Tax=Arenibacter certesii TaxID=228955 RepID=A0A918MFV6_9FLAO|nr:universal stress protein UspA [Arenibacter certesii]